MDGKIEIILYNAFIMGIILIIQIITLNSTRKDIYIGVRIPEEQRDDKELKHIGKQYIKTNLIIGILSITGLSYLSYIINKFGFYIIEIFVFLGITFYIYIKYNKIVKQLKKKNNWLQDGKNIVVVDTRFSLERSNKPYISYSWFIIPIIIIIINFIINLKAYPNLPSTVATNWSLTGKITGYKQKSPFLIYLMPLNQIIITLVMFISFKIVSWSKQQISGNNPQESIERNKKFRKIWSVYFVIIAILMNLIFTGTNLKIMGIMNFSNIVYRLMIITITGLITISSIIISVKVGQGGSKLNLKLNNTSEFIQSGDDDGHWKFGNSIYYNPNDPSLFIEKRFGIGWTINAGRPLGMALYIIIIIAVVFSIVMAILNKN
ncbi:DUF1648 domain-containing protein [Clostridium rectalis]|uniref:DUF1648 domain-containing protein n=1 Tax=Clostridium rectalis TaxID=2040295 RepID=UPI000F637E2E|nr:DUF5808 domain-containing protein [Clostridium rectalis]